MSETGWEGLRVRPEERIRDAAPELLAACRKDVERIRHLCGMVNTFAVKLGLGTKVHAEDWDDVARAAIAKATG